ncbi:hypothetical protein A3D77_07935 [Candidatus Gottesmanbacteria bacterium RIFCSPHIGHO2_02_FULL_39_11]|uniref:Resolvase HTH domain-containing protein n=1 Tax=Candidatus Gottesmanbacteria bacterium RIFCSPHIGHO2_02_FULL_39_11 TaxID=1798382 RepID=A0A1F5ZLV4_9BACT|nr:MAG: hypothetical protein A3D77_07935 [Candidatus Gottesmanbacteria bacterium RIFCSPHIGHO2_02_FULL_39_11]
MGYYGKLDLKQEVINLRRKGLSYREIVQKVRVSKDTVSRWCEDIRLTADQEKKLQEKRKFGQKKGSMIAANRKRQKRIDDTEKLFLESKKELGQISKRDFFISGISLYAGEGNKTDRLVGFANSDSKLIKFMTLWFQVFCGILPNQMKGIIWIHDTNDVTEAIQYWSNLTGISVSNFYKSYIVKSKNDSRKIRKNIHQYGVFSIRLSNAKIHRKIMGWIYALFTGKIPSVPLHSPVAQR